MNIKELAIGQSIWFVTADRKWVPALVTAIHGEISELVAVEGHQEAGVLYPLVNLVYVVLEDSQQDQYGRQIDRETSVGHYATYAASGFFWCYEDEIDAAKKVMFDRMHEIKS